MKLNTPKHPNYAAEVVRVAQLVELVNCDNIVGMQHGGMQAVVGKDTEVGELGVLFPTEVVLSDEYLWENSLYRHAERNKDARLKGYVEDSRRVRAVKFRGHQSDAFFMPLRSLEYTGTKLGELKEGDVFDELAGHAICAKYEPVVRRGARPPRQVRLEKRIEKKLFPPQEHIAHFLRELRYLNPAAEVVVTQKLHGTNLRVANTLVRREKFSLRERLAKFVGLPVAETEYAVVIGSHLVVKGVEAAPGALHFYGEDVWEHAGGKIAELVPQGYIVYAEIVGWTPSGAHIQKGYTYKQAPRTSAVYVYRVATVNPQGIVLDLSWPAVQEFCHARGLKCVPELWACQVGEVEQFLADVLDTKFGERFENAVPLADDSPCDEGVVVRIEGFHPTLLKAKAARFLEHETKQLDAGEADIEAEESADPGE